ncbi:putative cytochrome P450 oxidoreductase [Xylogone sp. PMI_703]|nr:putative cytochrome P450 oxidoreductase [Xylogone sp. PMI_703]
MEFKSIRIMTMLDTKSFAPQIVLSSIGLLLLYALIFIGRRPKGCPPGPPTLPIIGNIHQLPRRDTHLAYQEWSKKYGPIFSLQLGQQTVIVLARGEMIKKIVDKRSANYADRPNLYVQDIWEHSRIIMRSYDDLWKVERKLYHMCLNSNVVAKYIPYQSLETKKLCYDLLEDPLSFVNHIGRTTTSIATSMTYGFRINSYDSPVLQKMFENAHGFFSLVHGSQYLDWFPVLKGVVKILPTSLNPFAVKASKIYHAEREHFRRLFEESKHRGEQPGSLPNIVNAQQTWKDPSTTQLLTDHAAAYIAGISFEGGSDTTRNTLIGFVKVIFTISYLLLVYNANSRLSQAMALFPEAQHMAQIELNKVVGNRLPEFEDFDSLPYIRCTIKEALRWMPTAISGAIPHAARKADNVDGYYIPAGATVVLAVWSCNNDELQFDDPRVFNPARHNSELSLGQAATAADVRNRDQWTFGAGRRICPGLHMAEKTLFLAIARVLWAFNITPSKDENGEIIHIDRDAVTQSIAACPLPFRCEITPRGEEKAQAVRVAWEEAQTLLNHEGNYKASVIG